jgi:hypothetical protein
VATPNVVEVLQDSQSNANASITTAAGTQAGDLLVAAFGNNYYSGASMVPPTGTAGTWADRAFGDAGTNTAHLRLYTRQVTSGGAQTVTVAPVTNEEVYLFVYVIRDWSAVDDATATASATQTVSPVASSAVAVGVDDLLLCFWQTGAPHGGPTVSAVGGGMTDLLSERDPAGPFSVLATARQVLAASGATGTRTATISAASQYAGASIVIAGTSGGTPVAATGRAAAAAVGLATARKVAPGTGRACLAPAASATARKVVVVSARASAAVAGSATARKVAPAAVSAPAAAASSATARKAAPATGRACAVTATSWAVRKLTPASGLSSAAISAVGGGRKLASVAGRGMAAAAASAALRKVAPATGAAYAAAWSYRSQVSSRQISAVCSAAIAGLAVARKVLPASGTAASATYSRASAVHVGRAAGVASAAAASRAQAARVAVVTGRGVLAVTATATARKSAPAAGRAYVLALPLHAEPQESADLVGKLSASDQPRAHLTAGAAPTAFLSSASASAVLTGGDE